MEAPAATAMLWDWSAAAESPSPSKKSRLPSAAAADEATCQVEGCGAGLAGAKDYHRKHRVCEEHSKCPRVVVDGQERRFCQQCSRFHPLSEFDQQKRSCRRRLSDHNARRRKPQPEAYSFGSMQSSLFFGGTRQISFVWDKNLYDDPSSWENQSSLKTSLKAQDIHLEALKTDAFDSTLQLGRPLPSSISSLYNKPHKLLHIEGAEAAAASSVAAAAASFSPGAPNLQRALSLLSSSSSGSSPDPVPSSSIINFSDAGSSAAVLPSPGSTQPSFSFDGEALGLGRWR